MEVAILLCVLFFWKTVWVEFILIDRRTNWFRQGDPIFVSREVSQDLEVIGPPKFQRLRNRSSSGCRETVQSKTTKNAEDIRCQKTEKMDRFSSDLYLFRDLEFFLNGFEPDSSCSADSKKVWVYYDQTCCKALKCILVQAPLRNACNQSQWCILTYT